MNGLNLLDAVNAYKVFDEASRIAWGQELIGVSLSYDEWMSLNKICDKICEQLTNYVDGAIGKESEDESV